MKKIEDEADLTRAIRTLVAEATAIGIPPVAILLYVGAVCSEKFDTSGQVDTEHIAAMLTAAASVAAVNAGISRKGFVQCSGEGYDSHAKERNVVCPACLFSGAGLNPTSAAWHREHRDRHVERFPDVDAGTRAALDRLIASAEARERKSEERLS